MKRCSGTVLSRVALAALLVLAAGGAQAQNADVAGEWDVTINSPQGTNQAVLILKKDGDVWSGLMKGARGERPLQDVSVKGNEVRFAMKVNFQGQDAVFTYSGTHDKGALKGSADFAGMASGDWSAVRKPAVSASGPATAAPAPPASPGAIDISGNWVFTVDTGAGSGQPTFSFKQDGEKLSGTYSGAFGKANLTGTVKGGEVKFSFSGEAQGQSAEVVYTGKIVNKDSMQGTVQLGGLGEGTWTGKRQ
jgi:hypothetical protein